MKRLDLHPITYGIPSLQHTVKGRSASHSTERPLTASTRDGTVCTEYSSRSPAQAPEPSSLGPRSPLPSCPWLLETKVLPVWDTHSDDLRAEGVDQGRSPRGVGLVFYLKYMLLYFSLPLFFFFFLVKNKERKKKENEHITVLKYCLTSSMSLCSVCAQDWAKLTSALGWG